MKLKDEFITQDSDGEQIMVAAGGSAFQGLVRSNSTAAFIINCLKEETTKEAIIEKMTEFYDAPEEVIAADVANVLEQLKTIGAWE